MTTTFDHPADPLPLGATAIQSTNFELATADYAEVSWRGVLARTSSWPNKGEFMPKSDSSDGPPNWQFAGRQDSVAAIGALQTLIGFNTTFQSTTAQAYVPSLAANRNVSFRQERITAYIWYPFEVTIDGVVATIMKCTYVSDLVTFDPENRTPLLANGTFHRPMYELLNFLYQTVAAGTPISTRLLRLLIGQYPL